MKVELSIKDDKELRTSSEWHERTSRVMIIEKNGWNDHDSYYKELISYEEFIERRDASVTLRKRGGLILNMENSQELKDLRMLKDAKEKFIRKLPISGAEKFEFEELINEMQVLTYIVGKEKIGI
ncbi:MAG: hypothetical protein F6K19_01485 [Cyanothece sp. SIO1E1]|nr:hypothetical protein [Cyanothece sp. SIO1E1]